MEKSLYISNLKQDVAWVSHDDKYKGNDIAARYLILLQSSCQGLMQFGGGPVATIPRLAQAAIMRVHRPIVHTVHTHPQNPPRSSL